MLVNQFRDRYLEEHFTSEWYEEAGKSAMQCTQPSPVVHNLHKQYWSYTDTDTKVKGWNMPRDSCKSFIALAHQVSKSVQ